VTLDCRNPTGVTPWEGKYGNWVQKRPPAGGGEMWRLELWEKWGSASEDDF